MDLPLLHIKKPSRERRLFSFAHVPFAKQVTICGVSLRQTRLDTAMLQRVGSHTAGVDEIKEPSL